MLGKDVGLPKMSALPPNPEGFDVLRRGLNRESRKALLAMP